MGILLTRGASFNLTRKEPRLKKILIGLGWEMKAGSRLDLDASVFMLGENGKLSAPEYFVFYNNLYSGDGSVRHTGDNRSGAGDGDDEIILADLDLLDAHITELLLIVSIHKAEERGHHFGQLDDAYIRLADMESKRVILRYDLDAEFPDHNAIEFGRLKRVDNEWIFTATGVGSTKGLQGYVNEYV